MTIWAIVPVKPLRLGKSRLAGVLSDDERTALNRLFLENTLSVLQQTPEVNQTLVVSRDPAALAIAREFGARTVLEDGSPDLNRALRRATLLARAFATRGVFILPADLPLLTPGDLQEFFARACDKNCVTIAPDRREDGTNALLILPGGLIDYIYGAGSFQHHCDAARKAGARLEIVRNPRLALDLDTPDDLDVYNRMKTVVSW
ncbi:MAG: 2-phospho-L-lactate guanylyltransferase [Anaerolineales bacterium]